MKKDQSMRMKHASPMLSSGVAQPGVGRVEEEHLPQKRQANPMLRQRMAQPEVERDKGGGRPRTVQVR